MPPQFQTENRALQKSDNTYFYRRQENGGTLQQ